MELPVENTGCSMARYSALLGRSVEVQYRAGDICLPASGTLVADSGRSIFLEQHFEQRGLQKTFRWEVPYAYIVRIEERPPVDAAPVAVTVAPSYAADEAGESGEDPSLAKPQASAAHAGAGGGAALLPLQNRPKTA
jgi:hypothetical protein